MPGISSRERMLAALRYESSDEIPLVFFPFGFQPPAPIHWSNQVEEAETWLSLGADALLRVGVPVVFHPSVRTRGWVEKIAGERWPLMVQEYETPAGVMRQEVWRTDDWSSEDWPGHKAVDGQGISFIDDYNVPRSRKFAVETEADLARLKFMLPPLEGEAVQLLRANVKEICDQAARLGVVVEAEGSRGVDMLTWLCGVENMVMMAMDRPGLFSALLDIIHAWDLRATELLLETPVDIVVRRGWYEGTTFWSPRIFQQFFQPHFREITDLVHSAGRLMAFKNSAGFMALLEPLREVGIDAHYFIDPVMGGSGVDLRKVKAVYKPATAVIGGINSAVTLERGTEEEIRQAVFDAIDLLGPDGLVLTPVDCISASTPWSSVETVIAAWKERRKR